MNEIIFPLTAGIQGDAVADLQNALQLCLEKAAFLPTDDATRKKLAAALQREHIKKIYGEATGELVGLFQKVRQLQVSGSVDEPTANALNELLRKWGEVDPIPTPEKPVTGRLIEGRILLEDGQPAGQLELRLYRLDFGGKATLLKEATAGAGGEYSFAYDLGGRPGSFEIRAVQGENEEIALSKPLNDLNGEFHPGLNLVAPDALPPLAAEYRRLSADLTPHVGQMTRLAEARENAERQDLTVLNLATGWDARLIALAAATERLMADGEVGLPAESVYGLLRAGLPSDKLMLAQVEPEVAEQALKTVRAAGIVELTDQQAEEFGARFAAFANTVRLNVPAPGSRSTYGELLKGSGLSADAQAMFAPVYLRHRGDASQLWDEARQAGLDEAQVGKLQLHGKLAFLTGNSEGMTARLMKKQMDDPAGLVEQDFHRADSWVAEILGQADIPLDRRNTLTDADRKKIEPEIPSAYVGDTVDDRLASYAEDMARKVRLSYPTQVLGRLMETDEKFKALAPDAGTRALLRTAAGQGFRLGETPVAAFLKAHPEVSGNSAARQGLQALQRVYQITPSNEAMPVLMGLGITSAYDVMSYPETAFTGLFDAEYRVIHTLSPTPDTARKVYRKAKQVSSVTYNLFTIARKMDSETPVAGMSAPLEVQQTVRNELIKQFPTMESLFGSMDFCECEHCRSVLSPAAYLVDLFQFVDAEPGVWANFLAHWKANHGNQDYPHQDKDGKPMKPYDVLKERRPDLPHIPLTCENTHTALPYIDVVNEILEYYVANGKLQEDAVQDTGDATTADLLAEPQNVIRAAYDKLREARYPLALPFDLWSETVRQFCNYFETPLARLMEVFRPGDDLFAPAQPFDRSTIFMEALGFSPEELAVFTDPAPLARWHELYGFTTAAAATTQATDAATGQRADLNSAKTLSRRLGVTYKEMAEIVQTGFVNPKLEKLGLLYRLGVGIHDVRFYLDHKGLLTQVPGTLSAEDQQRRLEVQAFLQKVGTLAAAFSVSTAQLETELQAIPFNGVLVLADPNSGCDFDLTTLRYASGAPADAIAFLRINLFVRLWRKLGWSIEETDRALQACLPTDAPFETSHLGKQPLRTALIYLAHLKELDEKVRVGKQSRLKLLTLWTDIATTGRKPLYAQLFLARGLLKSSPVFDHPLGRYLSTAGVKMKDHLLAVQGALGLTADEIGQILQDDAGKVLDTAELSLPQVSLLYRYGLLAKALKLSVRELIGLKQLSGLDPFTPLHPSPLADTPAGVAPARKAIELDYPFSQTLRFVEVAGAVKDSALKIEDLQYLLRHRFDNTGKYPPRREGTMALLLTLAKGVRAIRAEHAPPGDPGAVSDEVLRQKLGLILPPNVVGRFMAMMNGSAEFTATRPGVAAADQLGAAGLAGEPAIREVRYNATRQEQKLTFRGVLFDAQKNDLTSRLPQPIQPNPHIPSAVLADLLDDVQAQGRVFFATYLQKQAPNVQPVSGFLDAADFDLLFDRDLALGAGETEQDRVRNRRAKVSGAFLPFLQTQLIRQFIVQAMITHSGAAPVLVESLLTDERLMTAPGALLEALTASAERGITATFFASAVGAGASLAALSLSDADTGAKDKNGNPLKPAGAGSALFEGYLEVPTAGAYRFHVALDKQSAEAELRFDHLPDPMFLGGAAAADNAVLGDQPGEFLELKPGIPYRFSLGLKKLNGGDGRLLVQGETMARADLSQLALYPLAAIQGAERAVLLLEKALQLADGLGLNERELRYLLTHAASFDGLSLSQLPTRSSDDTPTRATGLFRQFLRLAGYARLKRDVAGGTDDLIGIFEANEAPAADKLDQKVYPLLANLTRRDEATIKATAMALVSAPAVPAFESEKPVQRLWEALQIVERFGVPVGSLLEWVRIVSPAAAPQQRFEIARGLKESIKARFEPETWQRAAQPIFDNLRQRQRDALVAHVMHQHGFARMEQLYEYFLIDPGMEPVVQTSRIRLAIASMQLFIQRCLLNMELHVHPSLINSRQWEWMKRYRVWEANRKIFLFPENWLEPEFRDDKTHLFSELEGALLQGDVSSDLAEDAFLGYLRKLDELARLNIVAMHLDDNPDPALRTLHVIGRTYSQPHKYFYRRYAQQMWTPWEPVSAEIEGEHLAPVVWRDRLYLFWVTFLEKAREDTNSALTLRDMAEKTVSASVEKEVEVQLHWSEYLQGEWKTRESGGLAASIVKSIGGHFDPRSVFVHVSREPIENGGVYVHLVGPILCAFYLAGRNSAPEGKSYFSNFDLSRRINPYSAKRLLPTCYSADGALSVKFVNRVDAEAGMGPTWFEQTILGQARSYTLLPCNNNIILATIDGTSMDQAQGTSVTAGESGSGGIASLVKPVFYQDNAHTLFVEPSVTERTVEEWADWVAPVKRYEPDSRKPEWLKEIIVIAAKPTKWPTPGPVDGGRIDPGSLINPKPAFDWLVNPGTGLSFDGVLIGVAGQQQPGSMVAKVAETATLEQSGLPQVVDGFSIIGSTGFNSELAMNFDEMNRIGFSAGGFGHSWRRM